MLNLRRIYTRIERIHQCACKCLNIKRRYAIGRQGDYYKVTSLAADVTSLAADGCE